LSVEVGHRARGGIDRREVVAGLATNVLEATADIHSTAVLGHSECVDGAVLSWHTWIEVGVHTTISEDVGDL
jgi:hypothetical protein